MKTIDAWNAEQKANWMPPQIPELINPGPKPMGVACPCGAELHDDPGTYYGMSPPSPGIQCLACGKKGFIDSPMYGPEQITLCE